MNSREERERLKEEYKEHYRSILDSQKKLASYERKAKVIKALEQMNAGPVLDSLHNAMGTLREKITQAEAKFEVYLDDAALENAKNKEEAETFTQQQRARDTIASIRSEMGRIENELDRKVESLDIKKTISGEPENPEEGGHGRIPAGIKKTIGPQKTDSEKDQQNG